MPETEYVTLERSVAVTVPIVFWFSSAEYVEADEITGAVVSTTLTVRVIWLELPEASEDEYVSVYVPIVSVSTTPEVVTVTSPDASVAVAPASAYVAPNSVLTEASPVNVITGGVVSTTLTVLVRVAVFPEKSEAV